MFARIKAQSALHRSADTKSARYNVNNFPRGIKSLSLSLSLSLSPSLRVNQINTRRDKY